MTILDAAPPTAPVPVVAPAGPTRRGRRAAAGAATAATGSATTGTAAGSGTPTAATGTDASGSSTAPTGAVATAAAGTDPRGRFAARTALVADVARHVADEVDRDARPPREAIAAMREHGLLAAAVPTELGGEGATLAELSVIATELGRACAATAMVFAMHQGQAMALWRHGGDGAGVTELVAGVRDGALLASSTTERGIGGDARRSTCALEPDAAGRIRLRKDAPVISYATEADAILVTARRSVDAAASDQRVVVCLPEHTTLTQTSTWDTLGLRGTCSNGWLLDAETTADHVLRDDYATVSARTVLPVSHVLWASVWLGIAADAADRARAAVRKQARAAVGTTPPGALRLAELLVELQALADSVRHAAERFDVVAEDADVLDSTAFALSANALKIGASERVTDLVTRSLRIVGIAGYATSGPSSIARHLRDAHGAAVMVSNDRLLHNDAGMALMTGALL
ncbi:acyl-CoA dehydrogenase [Curtobacterium luteum]|uniref:Acyl-CoA dehydrogenase n=1 Tax=Curtobacterium luteum TaxID=33881 RepID=A0A8H9GCN9_9MICO|nr:MULTISPECIES: acyl-CoA dehydrogenase family protein [Curtobacterium]MBM7801305.1 acyl-CoA dehydrogenase [Curtobacterium luteum]GGL12533.1 acyl-CoA dehydrogenase [Curtobacterium luteum]